jgi:hypothetical protein
MCIFSQRSGVQMMTREHNTISSHAIFDQTLSLNGIVLSDGVPASHGGR